MSSSVVEEKATITPVPSTTCASCACGRAPVLSLTTSSTTPRITGHALVMPLETSMVTWRRHLHAHPELGFEEHKTAAMIAEKLRSWGIDEVIEGVGRTGVVGILRGTAKPAGGAAHGTCIALRADMDGLPIQEIDSKWNKEYKSKNDGVMHACGHDGHVAILLAVASILCANRAKIAGIVKFVFQPAEEGGGGAKFMIDDGVLDGRVGPKVDQMYGLHLWNYSNIGLVGVKHGPLMASSDRFNIIVTGLGGHGAVPNGTKDAVVAGAHLVTQLHTIVSRNISPLDPAVVTVGCYNSGYINNVIADKAELKGTIRALKADVRQTLIDRINACAAGIDVSFGTTTEVAWSKGGYPATENKSRAHVNHVAAAATKVVGDEGIFDPEPTMCSEDMSYYLQKVPGCFFFVGSSPTSGTAEVVPHHKSNFDIDERCLTVGASVFVHLIEDLLFVTAAK